MSIQTAKMTIVIKHRICLDLLTSYSDVSMPKPRLMTAKRTLSSCPYISFFFPFAMNIFSYRTNKTVSRSSTRWYLTASKSSPPDISAAFLYSTLPIDAISRMITDKAMTGPTTLFFTYPPYLSEKMSSTIAAENKMR